jgi:hypothetical protein
MKKNYEIKIDLRDSNIYNGKIKGTAFTYEYIGYWMSASSNYLIDNEQKEKMGIKFTPNTTFTVQDKTIYRFPKLNLPRQKVDLLKEKYNCKIIRDVNKADIYVVSDNLFNTLFESVWKCSVPFPQYFNLLQELKSGGHLTQCGIDECKQMIESLDTDSMIKIKISYDYKQPPSTDVIRGILDKSIKNHMESDHHYNRDIVLKGDNINTYLNIINSNATVIYDTDIINIIDDQLVIIENTEYDTIEKMITNNDNDNRSLALEMLANCNVDKSYDVVSGIFYWHYDWLKDTSNWNTINVKALRARMKKYQGGPFIQDIHSYDYYIDSLIGEGKLTKFALDKTRKKLYDTILGKLVGSTANTFNVSFDSLNLKESLKENLITNE